MDNWKPWIESIKDNKYSALVGLLILLALPITLILVFRSQDTRSNAAAPDNLETEAGTLSTSGVSKVNDSGASGGSYVLFNKAINPTPTNSPNPSIPPDAIYVPSSIDSTGNTDVTSALNSFISSVPDKI